MKKIVHFLMLAMSSLLIAHAQTNDTSNNSSPNGLLTNMTMSASVPTGGVPLLETNIKAASVETNVLDTNVVTAADTVTTNTALAAPPVSNIPLIQFSDVPITTAIENLARQAGINYMLDPKIGYGQPDANGQIKVEPTLSIRWENISAESALIALLDNYGLQLNEDKKTGIARITMKDPTAPPTLFTHVVQLQYASVSNMTEAVQSALTDKRSKVIGDIRSSQLVIVATDAEQNAVEILIKQLDKPTKQVLIETKLVEISSQPSTKKGVDWTATLSAQNVTFGNGSIAGSTAISAQSGTIALSGAPQTPVTTGNGALSTLTQLIGGGGFSASTMAGLVPMTGFLNADGVHAVLSFLNATYNAQIMSTPRIVTLDNETADIEVTRQFPIVNVGAGTQNSSGSSSVTYSNVGTILQVTPHVSANDKILLKVTPEVSSHFGDQVISAPGGNGNASFSFTVPIFDTRRMTTQVLIPNGNTLIMGGLVKDNPTASYTKVPLLGDIPGAGWAFRSENKTMEKDNLIIFLTPTIVQDEDFTPANDDFLKSQPTGMKMPMNPHTYWDGGEARGNWANPAPQPGEFDGKPLLNNF